MCSFYVEKALHFSLTPIKGFSLSNIAVYLLLFVWAVRIAIQKKFFESNNVNKYLILMILVALVSIPLKVWHNEIPNIDIIGELMSLKDWADPYIIFFILYNIIDDEKTCRNTLLGLIVFLFVTALTTPLISLGTLKISKVGAHYYGRAGGFTEPNQFASYLVFFVPLAMTYFLFPKSLIYKIPCGVLLIVCFTALVTTGSRGGALAFILSMAVYFMLLKRENILHLRGIVLVIMTLILVSFFSFLLVPPKVKQTVGQRFDFRDAETLDEIKIGHGRLFTWQNGLQIFLERPILGHGQRTFALLYLKRFGIWRSAHNNYLKHMVHFGVVGLAVFIMILTRIFQHVWHHFKATSSLWHKKLYISYIAGFLGYTFSMIGVEVSAPRILFWIYTAAIYKYTELDIIREN